MILDQARSFSFYNEGIIILRIKPCFFPKICEIKVLQYLCEYSISILIYKGLLFRAHYSYILEKGLKDETHISNFVIGGVLKLSQLINHYPSLSLTQKKLVYVI